MAEPISALPDPSLESPRSEPVPWPKPVDPLAGSPEISGSNSQTAVSDYPERFRQGFEHAYAELRSTASEMLERSRRRFQYMAQERPMQIVIGVAVAAFITGAALRIWRSNHA
jgi:hypothetical protein